MSEKTKTGKPSEPNDKVSAKTAVTGSRLSEDSPLMKMARDPKQAEAFLKEAGIIIRAGELAPEYIAREE